MAFAGYAQDFVEATSKLVKGRTINIMDRRGCIIASTEKERIGTFHAGAYEVLQTGEPVLISEENVERYPGAKKGYNLPIWNGDRMEGVIGIFGNPEEVEDIANLLRVYVTQYFKTRTSARRERLETEVRQQILLRLLSGEEAEEGMDWEMLGVRLRYPARVMAVRSGQYRRETSSYPRIEKLMLENALLRPERDLYGMVGNCYIALVSGLTQERLPAYLESLRLFLETRGFKEVRIALGEECAGKEQVPISYKEATALLKDRDAGMVSSISDPGCRMRYYKAVLAGGEAEAFLNRLQQRALADMDRESLFQCLDTAKAYYGWDRSVQKAAQQLHIHKNTLLYRMGRLYKCLGLEEEGDYTKEFFIRLLIVRLER